MGRAHDVARSNGRGWNQKNRTRKERGKINRKYKILIYLGNDIKAKIEGLGEGEGEGSVILAAEGASESREMVKFLPNSTYAIFPIQFSHSYSDIFFLVPTF